MNPVIELDNIVTLARVYFWGDVTASQQAKIKNLMMQNIQQYDIKYDINFDLKACTAEVLSKLT